MTGPFAPPPADGADRWSDQDPTQARTPVPAEPVPVEPVPAEPVPAPDPPPTVSLAKPPTDAPAALGPPPTSSVPAPPAPAGPPPAPRPPAAVPPISPVTPDPPPLKVSLTKAPPAGAPPTPTRRGRGVLPLALVGALTALMVLGVGYLGYRLDTERQTEVARDEAISASRDAARLLFSYDHTTLDQDFAKGLSVTTGQFRDDYSRTTSQVVADVARQYKAVVVADVVESAVIEAAPEEVTTLVFLNQATTSTQITGRQVDQSRVRMRLVERDGRWLVAEVQAL